MKFPWKANKMVKPLDNIETVEPLRDVRLADDHVRGVGSSQRVPEDLLQKREEV